MLLKQGDNLFCAMQISHMSVAICQLVAASTANTLIKVRIEEAFSLFLERR